MFSVSGLRCMCVDEDWELGRIPQEEQGHMVENTVAKVALVGVKLDARRVTSSIRGSSFAVNSPESDWSFCQPRDKFRGRLVGDMTSDLEFVKRSTASGMHELVCLFCTGLT